MAVCEVFSQSVTFKYKSTLCSKSAIFSGTATFLSIVLPFLVAYRSHGFWLKNSVYREQPDVRFKHDYFLYVETDQPDHPILCTTLPYSRDFDQCSVIKSREEDHNRDGKFDQLIFKVEVDLPPTVGVYSVQLILVFDYILQQQCFLQMESLSLIQYSSGIPGCRFDFSGDLRLVQRQLLTTRGRDIRFNKTIFTFDENSPDFNVHEIIRNYARRNFSTRIDNNYEFWTSGVLANEPFTISVEINYPEDSIMYKPSFWHVLKMAWIQYFSLLFIFVKIFQKIKQYVFQHHLVPSIKEIPWTKKFS